MLYHKGFLIRLAIVNLSPFNLDFVLICEFECLISKYLSRQFSYGLSATMSNGIEAWWPSA